MTERAPLDPERLVREVGELAERTDFSGVVRVDGADGLLLEMARGLAHRGYGLLNDSGTRFAIASGTKSFTALAIMSLVEDGTLSLSTTARELLGPDLPLIADDVTVENLLAHRSGIGDYLDEELHADVDDYVMSVPVHQLHTAEAYRAVLDGFPTRFPAGERFVYNNGGYVVLAILAERASGTPYHDLVADRVVRRAGMEDTDFPRSDEPIGPIARGYLEIPDRENVLHLPVRGVGDGGVTSTASDIRRFWKALIEGRIVSEDRVREMIRPRSDDPDQKMRYGLGFWLDASGDTVIMEGMDAGISFRSMHDPASGLTRTVMSNTSDGAWPMTKLLERLVDEATASA
jgi:CubicO group peptidase (beta-lactamase class C family)